MYVARDMDGTLWCGWDKPKFNEELGDFEYEEDFLELPTHLFWTEVMPGECREFVPGVMIFESGKEIDHAQ